MFEVSTLLQGKLLKIKTIFQGNYNNDEEYE